ncbi:MAG: anthranilate synthase component I family protein [Desulfobacteraceae bacterium]|jgi:anthranilate synthase component 1
MLLKDFPNKTEFIELAKTCNVIPVCREVLADMETPVSLLKKVYSNSDSVFLLESVEGGEKWGRYSFLGTAARTQVRIFNQSVEIKENGNCKKIEHNGDPLAVLRNLMNAYRPAQVKGLPRFWGGLVGYLTYEFVSFFETIAHNLPDDKPLAHFIVADELLIFDNIKNTLLCVVIAFLKTSDQAEKAFDSAQERLTGLQKKMMALPQESYASEQIPDVALLAQTDPEKFRQKVARVKEHITDGDIIQCVISQEFKGPVNVDTLSLYRAQRYINPSPYLYYLHLDDTTLVGSSPETMVRLENRSATLRPIAGTRPRGTTEQKDRALANEMLGDEKERAEHLMLVDLGRNDLGRVATTGTVQVTDLMVVERYSHVMHLVSNIICDLKPECDAWDLLRATFPAGTLSGAPKVRAMEIIAEMEETPRGPYGGAVGYISFGGNMDLAITIRTAIIEGDDLTVRAGAGIVADSDPEFERLETINKAKAIERALALTTAKGGAQ